MDDKTELPKLKRSWIFTKIGVLLFVTSIIASYWWLAVVRSQVPPGGDGMGYFVWGIACFIAIGVVGFISLFGFVIDCFRNRQKVVSVKKYKTNLIFCFCIGPIFFFVTLLFSLLVSKLFFWPAPPPPVVIYTSFGLSVLAAWFVGNLYRQTTKEVEQN